jgi:hypothetical protein
MRTILTLAIVFLTGLFSAQVSARANSYQNLEVAVYCRAQEVAQMKDPAWLEREWNKISTAVHVDKVYLEVHRDGVMPDAATINAAKQFFAARGIKTAAGITYTISEPNRFETFSYSNPEHRKRVQYIAEVAAKYFDEIILDDFFFTSTKSEYDIKARGNRSWTDYRLQLMTEAGKNLVIDPAKKINRNAKVIIKYPNWYEHFQGLGFNLETGPKIFDGIHTGTETRDAVRSAQHLQPYHGYSIMRYFENLAPGRNGGGWVDPFASRGYSRYAEQLWLTTFAKSGKQVALFDLRSITQPLAPNDPLTAAQAAGRAFDAVDKTIGVIGKPIALKSYKPFHSVGEDHLQSYLGMIGLPMEIVPTFPENESIILLTETAAADKTIVDRIEKQVRSGKSVVITSGLLKALQSRGISKIAEIEHTGRVAQVKQFTVGYQLVDGEKSVLIPQLAYRTNDSWELVSGIDGENGWPLLHDADYGKGHLFVLTVPDNFADFYDYPAPVLNEIRRVLTPHLPVRIEAASRVSLFAYDNGTFVVHNFKDEATEVTVVLSGNSAAQNALIDINSDTQIATTPRQLPARNGAPNSFQSIARLIVPAHEFRAFRVQ